ncbi:DNA integrity scanning diadenylate cyclase DisA [Fusobacterium gonidiaformans]|uniref:DNA integrity scanning diadenylate cyclase DisA n=1 Tax=Fusobacterium gonidiaformans TaxID=849 RepID=UPI0023EFC3ED|nr:DNA integrity scanning diadenylate cyclase DisA [Fusobacterium gonidiaformans]
MIQYDLVEIFEKIAPGTPLREGIVNILDGRLGALLILGYDEEVEKVLDGGFFINCDYTPERLFELAKMDGAIILDEKCEKILYANVHIQEDAKYPTSESGTRHRTAHRASQQLKKLVVAVSERKSVVTVYQGIGKYRLQNLSVLMEEATQALKILERYRYVLDKALVNLTLLELDDLVTVFDVITMAQRFEMISRIENELVGYVRELGKEAHLISSQLKELTQDIELEHLEFMKDYLKEESKIELVKKKIHQLTDQELLEAEVLADVFGYGKTYSVLDNKVSSRGYRILGKISKLTKKDIEKMVSTYGNIAEIQEAEDDDLLEIKLSKFKIRAMRTGIQRLKFTVELTR